MKQKAGNLFSHLNYNEETALFDHLHRTKNHRDLGDQGKNNQSPDINKQQLKVKLLNSNLK